MHYFVYKTTNVLDGKTYIGCHQTTDLNDGYLGSGKHLVRAIKKYGRDSFKREILHMFETANDMFECERLLVTEQVVADPETYNLKVGGSGGNPGLVGAFSGRTHSEETKEKQRQASLKQITTDEKRKKASDNNWAKKDPTAHREHMRKANLGKPKSAEHRKKISDAIKRKHKENNRALGQR